MFKNEDIKVLTPEEAHEFVEKWCEDHDSVEYGVFLVPYESCWEAIDNHSGDCNVEDFNTMNAAMLWLCDGEISAEEAKDIVRASNSFMSGWSDNML